MAILGQDHFTDTDTVILSNHVPDIGGSWIGTVVPHPLASTVQIYNNTLCKASGAADVQKYYITGVGSVANAYIQATNYGHLGGFIHLCGRIQAGSFLAVHYCSGNVSDTTVLIDEVGNRTELAGCVWSPTGNLMRMEISGTVVRAYYDGALVGSITTSLGAGYWGVQFESGLM